MRFTASKSRPHFRFTKFLQGQISIPLSIYKVLTGSNYDPFLIYNVFTASNQLPFFDLQGSYRVKSVSLFRFTRFLQGQISLPFQICKAFAGSNQSPFFDLQGFDRFKLRPFFDLQYFCSIKSASLFRFTRFLQSSLLWRNLDRRKMSSFALLYWGSKEKTWMPVPGNSYLCLQRQ